MAEDTSTSTPISFDLVTTTLNRTLELEAFLESLAAQTYRNFRLILVDQNTNDRIEHLKERDWGFPLVSIRSPIGISRGRNLALPLLLADVVAFPDDDCRYPPGLLFGLADRFACDASLDGVAGRLTDSLGTPEPGSWLKSSRKLDLNTVWHGGVSATLFLRIDTVRRAGQFDESLGLGGSVGNRSGEETDYMVRTLHEGARIVYDPTVAVEHPTACDRVRLGPQRGWRDGRSLGYILRKNGIPGSIVARMLLRPAGGTVLTALQGNIRKSMFHAATFGGRLRGYLRNR
jgi:glycosyltransferase involved in cell wall biosynthesis